MPTSVLTLPGSFARSRFGLTSNTQVFRSPLSGTTQTLERPGARWTAEYTLPPMKRAQVTAWQSVLAQLRGGAGRFYGYDPDARTPRGSALALATSSVNYITNGDATGAVPGVEGSGGQLPTGWFFGSQGGLTRQIVGSGTDNGVRYVEIRFYGTPTSTTNAVNFSSAKAISALTGQTWTSSLFYRLSGGSLTNIAGVYQRIEQVQDSGASVSTNSLQLTPLDSTWRRSVHTKTLTTTTPATAYVRNGVYLSLTVGQTVDITLRLGQVQVEQQAAATVYIPTTSAARGRGSGARVDGASMSASGTGGTTLPTWNWQANISAVLRAGDYVAFDTPSGHALHMLVADASSDADGRAVLTLEPPLRLSPPDNTSLQLTQASCVMALVDDSVSWDVDAAGTYRLSFSAEERF